MLVDSHCHLNMLDLTSFDGELNGVIAAARTKGIEHMLCVAVDAETMPAIIKIAEQFDCVSASVGLHPNDCQALATEWQLVERYITHPKVIAVGETGLDYYRTEGDTQFQEDSFRQHIQLAKKYRKPLIIHTREAAEDTLSILKEEGAQDIGGVIHCFTETLDFAKKALDLGFYISFSGIVTFKNAHDLQAVAKVIPIDRLLVETDAPFLTPVPYRGKPNYPAYVAHVAEFVAILRDVSLEELAAQTTANFYRCFHLNRRIA